MFRLEKFPWYQKQISVQGDLRYMFTDYETASIKIAWEFSCLTQKCANLLSKDSKGRQENMIRKLKGH